MNTLLYLCRRILAAIPILILVGLITFLLIHLTPGDPAAVVAGENASMEAIEAARHRLGLDQPFLLQFWHWLTAVVVADLGTSFTSGRPVTELIFDRMPITLSLTAGSTLIGVGLAVPLGVFAAIKRGSYLDRMTIFGTSLGIAAPEFFIGLLLVLVVALNWGWLPATGYIPFSEDPAEYFARLTLPSLTLGLGVAAELARQVRGAMIDVLSVVIVGLLGPSLTNAMTAIGLVYAPRIMRVVRGSTLSVREEVYITAARATGCSDARIIARHVLPNVTGPLVVQATVLMGQALLAEAGLSFLGLGVQPPQASWGAMLGTAFPYMAEAPVPTIAAGVVISVTVLCFNLIGDGIRDSVGRMRRAGD